LILRKKGKIAYPFCAPMNSTMLGYLGAIISSIFFGSNYVPVKNYPTGDGMSFVWVFSSGVLIVGLLSIFVVGKAVFIYTGLIGGSLWALGNLCVVPIVKLIGLGIGLLVWGSTSLITGFFVGKAGLFGLQKDVVHTDWLNWAGILLIMCAMAIFFFIKPTLEKQDYLPIPDAPSIQAETGQVKQVEEVDFTQRIPPNMRTAVGLILAVSSGLCFGVNMVPMQVWVQHEKALGHSPGPLDFVLCHFTGIYLFSSCAYFLYIVFHRPPQIFPETILPSFISGTMWGIAQCGLMMATEILGFTVGFPIGSTGPMIVSATWSVMYFREIRGSKNLVLLAVSFVALIGGIAALSISKS